MSKYQYVYLASVSDGNTVRLKVGHTWNLSLRMKQLGRLRRAPMTLIAFVPCKDTYSAFSLESRLHRDIRTSASTGEWHLWDETIVQKFSSLEGVQVCL